MDKILINNRFLETINFLIVHKIAKNKTDLSEKLEISPSKFSEILNKRMFAGTELLAKISEYYNVSTDWLLTGKGEMLKDASEPENIVLSETDGKNAVYLYDISAVAGLGSFDIIISKENIIGKYVIPDFQSADFMIYVKGSSMYPKYSSGDIIACKILYESQFIQWGKVYVVATKEQGLLVKRLKKCNNDNYISVISDNSGYEPFDIPKDEICGLALVLGVIRLE